MSVSRGTYRWDELPHHDILGRAAAELGLNVDQSRISSLLEYLAEMNRWNRRIKLVAPAPAAEQIILHLADSIAPLPFLPARPRNMIDLGSGGGLPGIPIKIVRPEYRVVLAEARDKKAAFLRHWARRAQVDGLEVVGRVDSSAPGGFDLATARAVAPLAELLPLAADMLAPGGAFVAYKGPDADREISEAGEKGGLILERDHRFDLPFLERRRVLLFYKKAG